MLKEEYDLVKEFSKLANKAKMLIPPMMFNDLRFHVSSIQRMLFAQEGVRSYRKLHAKYVVDHIPELMKKDKKHKPEISPMRDYGYQVKVGPMLADILTGTNKIRVIKKGSKVPKGWVRAPYTTNKYIKAPDLAKEKVSTSVRMVKKVPAGMKTRPLSKKDISELKELMTKGQATTQKIKVKFVDPETLKHQPVGYGLPDAKTGDKFVGGVHSDSRSRKGPKHNVPKTKNSVGNRSIESDPPGMTKKELEKLKQALSNKQNPATREGWTEYPGPMFISDPLRGQKRKAKKKNIPKKVGKKSPVKKQGRKKK